MFFSKISFLLLFAIVGTSMFPGGESAPAEVNYLNQLSDIQYKIDYQQSATPNGYGNQESTAQTGSNDQQSSMQQMDINQLSPLSNDRSYLENFIAQLRATNSQSTTERGSRNKRSAPQYTYDIKNASESDKIRLQQAIAQWISENPEFLQQYGHHNKQGKVENGDLYQIDINQILTWIQIQKEKSTPAAPSPRPRNHNPYEGRPVLTLLHNMHKWKLCFISFFTACEE
nr:BV-like protein [Cotesia vestalis bracovirus]